MKARVTFVLWAVLAVAIVATQGRDGRRGPSGASAAEGGVTRTVLVGATPESAPDQSLQLVRYDIVPSTTLPAHTHPGTQIAAIQSGELTYYVLSGWAEIYRGGSTAPERLGAGTSTMLEPGDAVVERETMVHYGANLGSEPVVILAATLLEAGMPPSVVQATPVA